VKIGIKLLAGLVLIIASWVLISTQWGWKAMPDAPAVTMDSLAPQFETAGIVAAEQLDAMRERYGVPWRHGCRRRGWRTGLVARRRMGECGGPDARHAGHPVSDRLHLESHDRDR
jgi:hypothetical protein